MARTLVKRYSTIVKIKEMYKNWFYTYQNSKDGKIMRKFSFFQRNLKSYVKYNKQLSISTIAL